ncbi:hypothetical protein BDFB_003422 [Asbolus verrucosus]|uniref:Uncharacterized protein n=1 Tax=Asbolus verrucosus TaxID=1661398 RepID=A0A482VZU9_ASBVE|nr:hypothetical protein BDFB_003422 [Asbolus verrucosus]
MSSEVSRPSSETVAILRLLSRPNSPTCRIITSNYRTSASGLQQCCVTTFIFIGTIGFVLLLPHAPSSNLSHPDKNRYFPVTLTPLTPLAFSTKSSTQHQYQQYFSTLRKNFYIPIRIQRFGNKHYGSITTTFTKTVIPRQ